MKNKYNRLINLTMISLTTLVALGYCFLQYRNLPIVIALVACVFIVSIYFLLQGIVNLSITKKEELNNYIQQQITDTLANVTKTNEDTFNLYKATYVQTRKHNELLKSLNQQILTGDDATTIISPLRDAFTDTLNKSVKVIVKYNEASNNKLISNNNKLLTALKDGNLQLLEELQSINATAIDHNSITPITNELFSIKSQLDNKMTEIATGIRGINNSIGNINVLSTVNSAPNDFSTGLLNTILNDIPSDLTDDISDNTLNDLADDTPNDLSNAFLKEFEENVSDDEEKIIPFPSENSIGNDEAFDSNATLSPDDISKLFASMSATNSDSSDSSLAIEESTITTDTETLPVAEDVQEESLEKAPIADVDPNKPLSPEDIAALFASLS